MCGKRSNLAFDPEKILCPDCLIEWRDEVVKQHKRGKISFQNAYDQIRKRCRMTDQEALDLVFPPLGKDDFQSDNMAISLNFDPEVIRQLEAMHDDE